MKKVLSLVIALMMLIGTAFCAYADGGYGDNYGSIDDDLTEYPTLESETYLIDNSVYVRNIKAGTLCINASKQFGTASPYVYFENADGTELDLDKPVKTGSKIRYRFGNSVYDARTAVIYGDVSGDSDLSVTDITAALGAIVTDKELTGVQLAAGDVNCDGKISVADIVKLRAEILNDNGEADMIDYSEKTVVFKENSDYFKTQGRISNSTDGIALDFTGSAIEFTAACKGTVTVNFSMVGSPVFGIVVDGAKLFRKNAANNKLVLAENLEEGIHTFKIVKNNGPSQTTAVSVKLNGTVCRRDKDAEKCIEIIGDSITCGATNTITVYDENGKIILGDDEGKIERVTVKFKENDGNDSFECDVDWMHASDTNTWKAINPDGTRYSFAKSNYTATECFYDKDGKLLASVPYLGSDANKYVSYSTNGVVGYSYLLPTLLGYDYTIFCESGNQMEVLNRVYDKQYVYRSYIAATGGHNEYFRTADNTLTTDVEKAADYEYTRTPDIVFINMDTNSNCQTDVYKAAMQGFVTRFKQRNPDVKIIFGYGSMKQTWIFQADHNAIKANVAELGGEENNIYLFEADSYRDGGGGHPSVANDRSFAEKLAEFIKSIED